MAFTSAFCSSPLGEGLHYRKISSFPFSCDSGTCKQHSSRHHLLLITAQDESFLKKGTRIFNLGRKEKNESLSEEPAPLRGTRIFPLGAKRQSASIEAPTEEEEETPKSGTKFFSFGASMVPQTTKGGAIVAQKKGTIAFPFDRRGRQDANTVFVAGATGQIGARIAQRLLRAGFNVRGGVRDLFFAQQVAEFATQYGVLSQEAAKRLNAVEFDFKNVESIAKAIGSASKVVVTIGPTEDGPKSKVSFEDASNVIEATKLANVPSLVVVYEPGTTPVGDNPFAGLALFFSELFSKPVAVSLSELLAQIVDSDVRYTLLKTSPSEGVDDYSLSLQNIEFRKEGTAASLETSKISKDQIAYVVSQVLLNLQATENKVIEVLSSPSASARPISELLSTIPTDGRREALLAARAKAEEEQKEKQARLRAEAEAKAAVEDAQRAVQRAAQLEAEAKQLAAEEARAASLVEKAKAKAASAAASVDSLSRKIKELGPELFTKPKTPGPSLGFSLPTSPPRFSVPSLKSTFRSTPNLKATRPLPQLKKREATVRPSEPEVTPIFGGLFSQETVYIDD